MLSIAALMNKWISIGITPKYIKSTLVETYTGTAVAADAGILLYPLPGDYREKLILRSGHHNLGQRITYRSDANNLPQLKFCWIGHPGLEEPQIWALTTSAQWKAFQGKISDTV